VKNEVVFAYFNVLLWNLAGWAVKYHRSYKGSEKKGEKERR
jgi:hypothetical protein